MNNFNIIFTYQSMLKVRKQGNFNKVKNKYYKIIFPGLRDKKGYFEDKIGYFEV